jgi:hypothetical protein
MIPHRLPKCLPLLVLSAGPLLLSKLCYPSVDDCSSRLEWGPLRQGILLRLKHPRIDTGHRELELANYPCSYRSDPGAVNGRAEAA